MEGKEGEFIVPELSLVKRLGGGAFGSVWFANGTRWSYSAQKFIKDSFAVKKITKGEGSSFTEIEVQNCLGRHPNICYLFDWMEQPPDGDYERIWLIYEYCNAGSLNTLLLKREIPVDTVLDYCQDIVSGVVYMHQHRVVHLDLKADNILLHRTRHGLICKVSDFGISRLLADTGRECYKVTELSKSCGPWYSSAPEVFLGTRLTDKTDIFSLGLLILAFFMRSYVKIAPGAKLITPFLNFRGRQGTPLHEATQDEIYYLVDYYAHKSFRHLLNRMLQLDYHHRPFVEEVMEKLERLEVDLIPAAETRSRPERVPSRQGSSKNIQAGSTGGMSTTTVDSMNEWFSEEPRRPTPSRQRHHQMAGNVRGNWVPPRGQRHPQGQHWQQHSGWGHPQLVQTQHGWQWVYPQQHPRHPQVVVVQTDEFEQPESTLTIEELDDDDDEPVGQTVITEGEKGNERSLVYDATLDRLDDKIKEKASAAGQQLKEELNTESKKKSDGADGVVADVEPPSRVRRNFKSRADNTTTTAARITRRMGPETLQKIQDQDAVSEEVEFEDDTDLNRNLDLPTQSISDRIKMFSQIPRTSSMTEKRSVFIPLE